MRLKSESQLCVCPVQLGAPTSPLLHRFCPYREVLRNVPKYKFLFPTRVIQNEIFSAPNSNLAGTPPHSLGEMSVRKSSECFPLFLCKSLVSETPVCGSLIEEKGVDWKQMRRFLGAQRDKPRMDGGRTFGSAVSRRCCASRWPCSRTGP